MNGDRAATHNVELGWGEGRRKRPGPCLGTEIARLLPIAAVHVPSPPGRTSRHEPPAARSVPEIRGASPHRRIANSTRARDARAAISASDTAIARSVPWGCHHRPGGPTAPAAARPIGETKCHGFAYEPNSKLTPRSEGGQGSCPHSSQATAIGALPRSTGERAPGAPYDLEARGHPKDDLRTDRPEFAFHENK